MNAADFHARILAPSAAVIEAISPQLASDDARLLLLAISGQESGWTERRQIGGPARGMWQCEQKGACIGVLSQPASAPIMRTICAALEIQPTSAALYLAIEFNDPLAYAVARCIVWPDPRPLPAPGDEEGAWQQYVSLWRPGKPDRARWTDRYAAAMAAFPHNGA